MRPRDRLRLAAVVCAGVCLTTAIVAYLTWPAPTASSSALTLWQMLTYGYAALAGSSFVAAIVLAGLAARRGPTGARNRCTACTEPVPASLSFCPACGRREPRPGT